MPESFFPLQYRPLGYSVLREIISLSAHFQFWYPLDLKVEAKTLQGIRYEDFGTTMQLYAQSDMKAIREAQGKFLEQLLGDRIDLLTETVQ
jgi:hypothetical protein